MGGRNRRKGRNKKAKTGDKGAPEKSDVKKSYQPVPKIAEHISDSDDEEIPEDEAFNSDDERKWGAFFSKSTSSKRKSSETEEDGDDGGSYSESADEELLSEEGGSDEDESGDGDEDDDDDDDGGQYMLDLLNNMDADTKKGTNPSNRPFASSEDQPKVDAANHVPESEHSAFISSKQLTLDTLMHGLEDTDGFTDLQKTFQRQSKTTLAPLQRVVADRTQRKIVYKKESQDISKWTPAVLENKHAETLDFRPKEKIKVTRDTIIGSFEPTTDMEKELEQALIDAGQQDEEAIIKAEEEALQDDLGANRLSADEYQKRRGQLAQMRALLFYHEQKRHHINKIKSKKYRRIRKKQRERVKESELEAALEDDEELAQELKEKEEVSRIQERMTLAHKNTSKWAKRVLKRGKNVDVDTRRALSAQLQRGNELRQKMMHADDEDSGRDDDSDEDLVAAARRVLKDAQGADESEDAPKSKSGLFQLAFMQKGVQKQRERAQEEARKLLSELEANERDDYDENVSDEEGDGAKKKAPKGIADKAEMKKVLRDGSLVATSLDFGGSKAIATSGGIDIQIPSDDDEDEAENAQPKKQETIELQTEHESTLAPVSASQKNKKRSGKKKESKKKVESKEPATASKSPKQTTSKSPSKPSGSNAVEGAKTTQKSNPVQVHSEDVSDDDSNPWVAPAASTSSSPKKRKSKVTKAGILNVEGVVEALKATAKESKQTEQSSRKMQGEEKEKINITDLSQEELVQQAFATLPEKDIDEEFAQEKQDMIEDNDPDAPRNKKQKKGDPGDLAGWGSWAGKGTLPPPPPGKRKLPSKLEAPKKKKKQEEPPRKDQNRPNLILNEKRIKRTANVHMIDQVPYPFASRAEYEQSMMGSIGREWNVTSSFKNMTRPEILTRSGKIIQPISKRAKQKRPAAKF